jgi:dephospho-CoA kinase
VKTIGVTGGIGSGKSTAARLLAELGAEVIDADQVGHHTYRPGSVGWQRIADAFGGDVVAADGTIDRKRLGAVVFSDPKALARLNAIVHPLIQEEVRARIDARRAAGYQGPIVVEAAVLIEAGWTPLVDEVWLVVTDRESVLDRVHAQRGLERSAIEARINSQLSDAERRRHATVVIDNSGSPEALRAEVKRLWRERLDEPRGS